MLNEQWDITYTPWGIANRFNGRTIQLNTALKQKKWARLHDSILEHEKAHTSGWGWKDVALDLKPFPHKQDYRLFILTHPSSWVQFIPVWRFRRQWYIDLTLCIFYAICATIIGGLIWLI